VEHIAELPETLREVMDRYHAGDAQGLADLTFDETEQGPQGSILLDTFFYRRNAHMAEVIDTLLREDKTFFIVVGAGNLIGERTVRHSLEDAGYSVSIIPAQGRATAPQEGFFGPEDARQARIFIQERLDSGDLHGAVAAGMMSAYQAPPEPTGGAREGYSDEDLASILSLLCEPLQWLGQWAQAGSCWTRLLQADQESQVLHKEERLLALGGAALAALRQGDSTTYNGLVSQASWTPERVAELSVEGRVRYRSFRAQSLMNLNPELAFQEAQRAYEDLVKIHPLEHPALTPVLMVLTSTAFWLDKSALMGEVADALLKNLKSAKPLNPALIDVFTLKRASIRAESGDKSGARTDLIRAIPSLSDSFKGASAQRAQYLQGAAKVYTRLGDFKDAAALLKRTQALLKAEDLGPVLQADQLELQGRLDMAKGKKRRGLRAMAKGVAFAEAHLTSQPAAVAILQCRLAQDLDRLRRSKKKARALRAKALEGLKASFSAAHPIHAQCAAGRLPW